jgi:menaquinone-9 beta-reductase
LAECDVLIVGAGPAGTIAGLVAARAGARVCIVDRATFPRDKLCGDTVNPGTMTILRRLGLSAEIERRGLRVGGMILTGERGVSVEGRYPEGASGYAMVRRALDSVLLAHAVSAGCQFEPGVAAQRVVVAETGGRRVATGVAVGVNGRTRTMSAPVVIAADGRRSAIAWGLGLARHPARPRRWAIGAYFDNFGVRPPTTTSGGIGVRPRSPICGGGGVRPPSAGSGVRPHGDEGTLGEMHVRRNCYIGVAQVPGGLTNVCLVKPSGPADAGLRDPSALLLRELADDPLLRDRAAGARFARPPVVLGPLAVDVDPPSLDGLLLAGDAAGFIDPMTGDGLRFAVRGGELAADAALDALAHGWTGVHARLANARRRAFAGKWRFNRALRALVASPRAVELATLAGRFAPGAFQRLVTHAGDCGA